MFGIYVFSLSRTDRLYRWQKMPHSITRFTGEGEGVLIGMENLLKSIEIFISGGTAVFQPFAYLFINIH